MNGLKQLLCYLLNRYFLQLVCSGPSMLSNSSFNIVESNMFQDITYLSLSFLPASDSDVKRYLADGLKILKVVEQ